MQSVSSCHPIVAVHVLPTNEVENIQLHAPTVHMFGLLHPFVGSCAKSTRRTNINASVVAHMTNISQLLIIWITKWHALAPNELEVNLVLWEAWYIVLEIHCQVVALLLWGRYPT